MYDDLVIKRTSINLDQSLVREAKEVLGTEQTTETVHRALREVVRQQRLRRLAERDFPDLTLESLKGMRRGRSFEHLRE